MTLPSPRTEATPDRMNAVTIHFETRLAAPLTTIVVRFRLIAISLSASLVRPTLPLTGRSEQREPGSGAAACSAWHGCPRREAGQQPDHCPPSGIGRRPSEEAFRPRGLILRPVAEARTRRTH